MFYHGAKVAKGKDIEIFDTKFSNGNYEHRQLKNLPFGFFFSSDLKTAKGYTYNDNELVKKVFLKAKNPLIIDFEGKTYNQGIDDSISQMGQEFKKGAHDAIIYKNIIDDSEQDTRKINKIADTFIVFDSNQIKAVGNKGTFDGTNPNIYHSSSTAGGGVLGGSIAGVERDDEGNIIGFSPEKFALGFATGASGAKALSKIAHTKSTQNLSAKTLKMLTKKAHTNPRAKAILEKIQAKSSTNNDKMPSQKLATISPEKTQKGQTNMQNPHIKILRDNLKQALSPILNTDIINKNTGIVARLSTNGLNKISSSMAVKKSIENGFSRAEHFAVASDLKNLFENATLLKTHDDYKKKPNIKAIHRYIAQTKINDKEAQALITLKESIQNGNRIYSMELEEVKPL